MNIIEIIKKYTENEATLEETNEALRQAQAGFILDPDRNEIKAAEKERYGMLDTGTGTQDKVEIVDGRVIGYHTGGVERARVHYMGKWYDVDGDKLVEA